MKVIIFGVGNYYQEQKEKLKNIPDIEIIALTDNNVELWDKSMDNVRIIAPDLIKALAYDCILIMSIYSCEIYRQLMDLGIDRNKIIEWKRFLGMQCHSDIRLLYPKRKILIVTQELKYDGGSFAAIYAARALRKQGMVVLLAIPGGNPQLIDEVMHEEIPIIVCPALPYIFETEKIWICQFDAVIINLFTMVESVCEISQFCPTLWWLHEASFIYDSVIKNSIRFANMNKFDGVKICAVSDIARNNFNKHFANAVKSILMLGIPDEARFFLSNSKRSKRIVFAIIGTVHCLKAQDVFVNAAVKVGKKAQAEFWIIGKMSDNDYCKSIAAQAANIGFVRLMGEMTRTELEEAFKDIDVVVCASLEETLSLTIIEAMMYGKVCITTENTGIAAYICNGVNGFVVPVNDVQALSETMEWIITNKDEIEKMGLEARKTYEENFTMEIFENRIADVLNETISEWSR